MAKAQNVSIAEAFLGAKVVVLVDVSGSMNTNDSRGKRSRYAVALEELAKIQASHPGQVAVIAFSSTSQFCPGGAPPFIGAGTDLADALRFAQVADAPGMRFIVVSDGYPDDEKAALAVAAQYKARIDSVFVGPESDLDGGRAFLRLLAQRCGGQPVTADRVVELAATVDRLLLAA